MRTKIDVPRWICYVPHGIDENKYFPIDELHSDYNKMIEFQKNFLKEFDPLFVIFFNNRNIRRKMPGDLILSYKTFCDLLPKEESDRCLLLLHTQPIDDNGTDIPSVIDALCPMYKVRFTGGQMGYTELNYFYNLADLTINIASNEGWGLSTTESLMAGTPILINVTGGLQDQARFTDENGKWIDFDENFSTNHAGKYVNHGEWCFPVFPKTRSVLGSPPTPYIFDDRCSWEDVAEELFKIYKLGRDERKRRGLLGREWAISDESMESARKMGENFIKFIDYSLQNWKPRKRFELIDMKDVDFTSKPSGILNKK